MSSSHPSPVSTLPYSHFNMISKYHHSEQKFSSFSLITEIYYIISSAGFIIATIFWQCVNKHRKIFTLFCYYHKYNFNSISLSRLGSTEYIVIEHRFSIMAQKGNFTNPLIAIFVNVMWYKKTLFTVHVPKCTLYHKVPPFPYW